MVYRFYSHRLLAYLLMSAILFRFNFWRWIDNDNTQEPLSKTAIQNEK